MNFSTRGRLLAVVFLALVPISAIAQRQSDAVPLRTWAAPLFWQPGLSEFSAEQPNKLSNGADATTPANALVFVAMTPCRIADTRNGSPFGGAFGPPSLAGGQSRTFPIQASTTCVIPNIAQAYSFNITLVPSGFVNFITVWPTGQPRPNASTLNGYGGTVIANAAIVPAGTGGAVDVYASESTNIIIDINGYYAPQSGLTLAQGSAAAPSLSFSGDAGTGIYSSGAGTLNIATGGTDRLQLANGNANLTGNLNVSANETVGGTLGVGMTPSSSRVEIAGQDGLAITGFQPFLTLRDTSTNGRRSIIQGFGGGFTFFPQTFIGGNAAMYLQDGTGRLGIGTSGPGYLLDVADRMRVRQNGANSAGMFFYQGGNDQAFVGMPDDNHVGFWGNVTGWAFTMDKNTGLTSTKTLQITGGSDLAEHFEVAEEVQPGMVVAIDPQNAGKVMLARGAYNRRVAGVISGAHDLSAGMLLPDPSGAQNAMAVTLSGRVWVYCDADRNPIKPGDLLTTSDTPGHAMKATNYTKAQGAIIGKAMTSLKAGQGLVLVLATLQ
jgi:hypothetical protein